MEQNPRNKLHYDSTGRPWKSLVPTTLADARCALKLTQSGMANCLDVAHRTYNDYETGRKEVPVTVRMAVTLLLLTSDNYDRAALVKRMKQILENYHNPRIFDRTKRKVRKQRRLNHDPQLHKKDIAPAAVKNSEIKPSDLI